jgi:hypothetical protein
MTDELKNPFDPNGGKFAKNIRSIIGDDDELRESMKRAGWIEHLPAFSDENDVVIVGHRRLKIAEELGIKPVVHKLKFGKGDDADTKRLQLAIASNTGGKGLTRSDRKRIAEHLYSKQEWTMQAIAEALNVSQNTISLDLRDLSTVDKSKHAKTATNPKGSGRSKGSKRKERPHKSSPETQSTAAALFLDNGLSREQVKVETGLGDHEIQLAIERERGRREAVPEITPDMLSMTAQQKFDAAMRQHKAKLDVEFWKKVQEGVQKFLLETTLPKHRQEQAEAKRVMDTRKGIMTKDQFNTIRRALHPDSRHSLSDARLTEAFTMFMKLEKSLLAEKDSPTDFQPLPTNWADWEKKKRQAAEARKAKHAASRSAVKVR